ncbi:MAG: RNA 2',3'-cyclic phosphodiesterase [Desulfobacterales bacterium]|nr:RNA 2',3'-cyclic phosphodiesterase [Desulfobacterales bacterium]
MPDTYIRSFIAIALDNKIKKQLARVQTDLKKSGIIASWPHSSNFHLTLAFLGDIPEQNIIPIKQALVEVAEASTHFDMEFNCTGVFPHPKNARVIWVGSNRACPDICVLHQNIYSKLTRIGCKLKKQKKYTPHITLARIKKKLSYKLISNTLDSGILGGPIKIPIHKIHLYKSTLSPTGAVHKPLFSAELT